MRLWQVDIFIINYGTAAPVCMAFSFVSILFSRILMSPQSGQSLQNEPHNLSQAAGPGSGRLRPQLVQW